MFSVIERRGDKLSFELGLLMLILFGLHLNDKSFNLVLSRLESSQLILIFRSILVTIIFGLSHMNFGSDHN